MYHQLFILTKITSPMLVHDGNIIWELCSMFQCGQRPTTLTRNDCRCTLLRESHSGPFFWYGISQKSLLTAGVSPVQIRRCGLQFPVSADVGYRMWMLMTASRYLCMCACLCRMNIFKELKNEEIESLDILSSFSICIK